MDRGRDQQSEKKLIKPSHSTISHQLNSDLKNMSEGRLLLEEERNQLASQGFPGDRDYKLV